MSIRAIKWAYSLKLPSTTKFVLVTLAEHADDDGECWPLQTRIAEMTGLCERSVRYALNGLKASGLVKTSTGKGRRGAFFLSLDVDDLTSEMVEIIAVECSSTGKKQAENKGKNRHQMPRNRHVVPTSNRHQMPSDRHSVPPNRHQIPNHRTTKNHQEPPLPQTPENQFDIETPESGIDAEFNEFWSAYPRKNAKAHARKAYAKARKTISASALLAAVKAWPFDDQVRNGSDFRPYAASWLNGERWEDETVQAALAANRDREQFSPTQHAAHQAACRAWAANGASGPKPKIEQFAMECA